jgi:hypothetical protein
VLHLWNWVMRPGRGESPDGGRFARSIERAVAPTCQEVTARRHAETAVRARSLRLKPIAGWGTEHQGHEAGMRL